MINALYNDYLTESEFDFEVACEKSEIDIMKSSAAYEAICEKARLDLREAELKCAEESGDMDDLESLYEEASEKTSDKRQTLIGKIWEAIKNFFTKIKNFFTGKGKKKADPEEECEVDEGTFTFVQKIKTWANELATAIKKWVVNHKALTALLGIGGVAATFGAIKMLKKKSDGSIDTSAESTASGKMITVKGSQINQAIDNATDGISTIEDAAEDAKKATGDDDGALSKISRVITAIGNAFKNALSSLRSKIGKGGKSSGGDGSDELPNITVKKYSKADYDAAKKAGVSPTKFAQMSTEAQVVSKIVGREFKWNNYQRFLKNAANDKTAAKAARLLKQWRKSDQARKANDYSASLARDYKKTDSENYVDNMKAAGWLESVMDVMTEAMDDFLFECGKYEYVSESYFNVNTDTDVDIFSEDSSDLYDDLDDPFFDF